MRGTDRSLSLYRPRIRFIPAHAGNSARVRVSRAPKTVHPRACGEQDGNAAAGTVLTGSSPRMRGTGDHGDGCDLLARFIPAHAGNSRCGGSSRPIGTVHPRACGEQGRLDRRFWNAYGSSPRMRGTVRWGRIVRACGRFIPAHAGNSRSRCVGYGIPSVHPRACGEQERTCLMSEVVSGSSPRMRRTEATVSRWEKGERFIPAHAGNSGKKT